MKKFLVCVAVFSMLGATSAAAADLPVKAPIYKAPPATVATWTGCYFGGNVGYGWSPTKWRDPVFGTFVFQENLPRTPLMVSSAAGKLVATTRQDNGYSASKGCLMRLQ